MNAITLPLLRGTNIVMNISVCLNVCVCLCEHISKTMSSIHIHPIFGDIACGTAGSPLADSILSLWMTLFLHIVASIGSVMKRTNAQIDSNGAARICCGHKFSVFQ